MNTGSETALNTLKRDVVWIVNNKIKKGYLQTQNLARRLSFSREDQFANYNLFTQNVSSIIQMPKGVPIPQVAMRTGYSVFRDGCVCLKPGMEITSKSEDNCCCPRKDFSYDRIVCTKHGLPMPCEECMLQFNPYYRGSNLPRRVLASSAPIEKPTEASSDSNQCLLG